jgi:GTP-binding protein
MLPFPQARFLTSAAAPAQFPADYGVEVAFAGRSNAGKSSAINAIVAHHGLARASKTPGRTRLINFFALSGQTRLVDLPGYGYASAPEHERRTWPALIEALRRRVALRGVFLIVDARRGLGAGDEVLIEWAAGRRVHVLLSKCDKLSRNEARRALATAADALGPLATVQLFSAHTGDGVEQAQRTLSAWLEAREPAEDVKSGG